MIIKEPLQQVQFSSPNHLHIMVNATKQYSLPLYVPNHQKYSFLAKPIEQGVKSFQFFILVLPFLVHIDVPSKSRF